VQVKNVKDGSTALVVALGGREWVVVANAGISVAALLQLCCSSVAALLQLVHALLQLWWWLSVAAGASLLQLKRVSGVVAKSGISLLQPLLQLLHALLQLKRVSGVVANAGISLLHALLQLLHALLQLKRVRGVVANAGISLTKPLCYSLSLSAPTYTSMLLTKPLCF
jgi:uncharacterized integral membrane protein